MVDIEYPTYLQHIRTESARFREALTDCDPAARVPGCPDWDASDLLWHLAEVQCFWAKTIRTRPAAPGEVDIPAPTRPTSYAELLEAFDDFSHSLAVELERADPDEAAWHWSPVQTVGTSYRRQAHEALIHRLDAEQTAGAETALDPVLSADGVMELFEVMYGGAPPEWGRVEPGATHVEFELLGAEGGLLQSVVVQPCTFYGTDPASGKNYDGPHLLIVDEPDIEPDVLVRGAAADMDAWLWKRRDESSIQISGDRAVYDAFRAAVTQPLD
jgi:uncharacterized protein (TIGR03083 family)